MNAHRHGAAALRDEIRRMPHEPSYCHTGEPAIGGGLNVL